MAYQTGSESSLPSLLSSLFSFAVANSGFVDEGSWADGTDTVWALSKNGHYFLFLVSGNEMYLSLSSGVDSGLGWTNQPGKCSKDTRFQPAAGPYTAYHFFGNSTNVRVALEMEPNRFNHFAFGEVVKVGNYSGGQFVTANAQQTPDRFFYPFNSENPVVFYGFDRVQTNSPSTIRVVENGHEYCLVALPGSGFGEARIPSPFGNFGLPILDLGPNAFNQRAPMMPIHYYYVDYTLGSQFRPIGYVEGAAGLNIANLTPGSVVNNDWVVFPIGEKNGDAVYDDPNAEWLNSENYGIAFQQ